MQGNIIKIRWMLFTRLKRLSTLASVASYGSSSSNAKKLYFLLYSDTFVIMYIYLFVILCAVVCFFLA